MWCRDELLLVSYFPYETFITTLNLIHCLNLALFIPCISLAHIFKSQQNALITLQQIISQNTLHIRCQLLHVSTPKCHRQGVPQQQRFAGPTSISSTIHPHFHHPAQSLKPIKFKLHIHVATTPMSPHADKLPPISHLQPFNFLGYAYKHPTIFDPKGSPSSTKANFRSVCMCACIKRYKLEHTAANALVLCHQTSKVPKYSTKVLYLLNVC